MRFPPLFDPSTELLLGFVSASSVSFRFSMLKKNKNKKLETKKNVVSINSTECYVTARMNIHGTSEKNGKLLLCVCVYPYLNSMVHVLI